MFFLLRLSLWTIFYIGPMMLSCWLTWYIWFKVDRFSHVDQFGNFIYKNKNWVLGLISLSSILPEPYDTIHLKKKPHALSLGYMLSSIKFCDPLWFYFVYAFDLRFYAQMNLVLLKYYLTIVLKKERDEKMACQRSMTQKREREREKMACQRSMTQQIKSDMKRSMYLSVH